MALRGGRALELPSPTYPTARPIGTCLGGETQGILGLGIPFNPAGAIEIIIPGFMKMHCHLSFLGVVMSADWGGADRNVAAR
jgi:hypothetical protein